MRLNGEAEVLILDSSFLLIPSPFLVVGSEQEIGTEMPHNWIVNQTFNSVSIIHLFHASIFYLFVRRSVVFFHYYPTYLFPCCCCCHFLHSVLFKWWLCLLVLQFNLTKFRAHSLWWLCLLGTCSVAAAAT